ncbi:MAG TPA: flagellin, partial [Polyangiaceae bacterium]|nr:flagellin [Polyangiaceae bacterium]
MPIVVQTNVASLEAQKNLHRAQSALSKSFNRLSSGYRINSAADDAAGLALSESMKTQIRSFVVAERNANDAISMAQTAEGALGEMHDILGRMRELAMQSANGSMTADARGMIDTEYSALKEELARIQNSATFNGQPLLNTTTNSITFQVGLNDDANDQLTINFTGPDLTDLQASSVTGSDPTNPLAALSDIDTALSAISTRRAEMGASMNRLEIVTTNIQTARLNLAAANSRIRDVDVAEEMSHMTKNQILSQAGVSVLAQAGQLPQLALSLLQG